MRVTKAAVRVAGLRELVGAPSPATIGIAHTRWATHGEPTDANAHPHTDASGRVAVVHNGIIENSERLRHEQAAAGVTFASETDTEALAHLIAAALAAGAESLEDAVRTALRRVEGTYGLVVLDARRPGELVAARHGSPLVIGIGEGETLVASDVAALVRHTQRVAYLEDGELATLTADGFRTSTREARPIDRATMTVDVTAEDYAVIDPDTLFIAVSQSGETLDTLGAVNELQRKGGRLMGVVNVVGSAIARACGNGVFLHAGPEVAVASTKAVTNMAVSFAMLGLLFVPVRDLSFADGPRIVEGLRALPYQIAAGPAARGGD